ncbi:ferrochelatase [Methylosinus sporium]|uniref:Ferrochelatase n=1 Tax=Methylosinus sporium TaxID=428 RepID=A0A549T9A3_METSR|nr:MULTISPECIES: ferrochelatase [Methylosinus]MBU3890884.1 ferrochelatase [Methylosinus sp. KRF6]TRL38436.1 ferrochelatase [Methylosinus sporium]
MSASRIGLLLVNLGTPQGADYWSVRRYLREFLSDRRVVDVPPVLWRPILESFVLTFRPRRSARAYRSVWNEERDEGPLKTITRAQAEKLGARFAERNVIVDFAMRYAGPSIGEKIDALRANGCERILMFPLYPQYAASTTASVVDEAARALALLREQPTLRIVPPFYDDPAYIEALAASTRAQLAALDFEPEILVASFHGLPQAQIDRGDPYRRHCEATLDALRSALGMSPERLRLAFQSRFGRTQWTGPYTANVLQELAQKGVKRVAVLTPGFVSDCLETLEEIGAELRHSYLAEGGENFARLDCLNDSEDGLRALETIARRELSGWL